MFAILTSTSSTRNPSFGTPSAFIHMDKETKNIAVIGVIVARTKLNLPEKYSESLMSSTRWVMTSSPYLQEHL
jgi:hypothetical protein